MSDPAPSSTAPSSTAPSSTAWPAARPTGIDPIQHPAWEAARNAILDLAAEGPVTAVIIGEPGTGKTWLLRELASALGDHGFPTMMLLQGDLPMTLSDGAALLVDEASMMNEATRAEMSAQRHGVAILAAADWVEDTPGPVLISLRPLDPAETAEFATEWLRRAGLRPIGEHALSALVAESGGRVGTIVRSLGKPAAPTPAPQPTFRRIEEPVIRPIRAKPPRRRSAWGPLLAGSALAAIIVLGWALAPEPPPTKRAVTEAPPTPIAPTATADATPPPLPPLHAAETPGPALAASAPPAQTPLPTAPLTAAPQPDIAQIPVETEPPTSSPVIAAAPSPPVLAPAGPAVLPPADPTVVATLESPAAAIPVAPPKPPDRTGGPGLVLIAQRGDTLASLYGSVYRDRKAPPFAKVQAANPGRFKPGVIVVFPEPPGGWQRVQR